MREEDERMRERIQEEVTSVIKETVYTSIGAAALAVGFATSPSKQQSWLKKAERKGSSLTRQSEKQIRKFNKQFESVITDVTQSSLQVLGLAETPAPKPVVTRKPRRRTTRRSPRRTARATLTVAQAS